MFERQREFVTLPGAPGGPPMLEQDAPAATAAPKAKIFISYSRKDIAFVDRLEPTLKERGFDTLIDRAEIYAFEDWWKRIEGLIGKADTVVFVLSPDSAASDVCAREVTHALELNKRFAPIVCRRVPDSAVPPALARLNFVFFDDPDRFDVNVDRLAEALKTDIGWIRKHTEYGEVARNWVAAGRPGGVLLRSPVLEEAEQWIASRPHEAPEPTAETREFVFASRRGATRRRNVLTGSLAAGFALALGLAGLAYWQRSVAIQERQYAERALDASIRTSNSVSLDLAMRLRNRSGVPTALTKYLLDVGLELQKQIASYGRVTPDLLDGQARALLESSKTRRTIGDLPGALTDATRAREIFVRVLATRGDVSTRLNVAVSSELIGEMLAAQGKTDEAMAAYQSSLADAKALADADATNTDAQEEVAIDHVHIGDALLSQQKSDEALAAYQASLEIRQKMVDRDKTNAKWQRGLGISHERLGTILLSQGKNAEALAAFRSRLAIARALTDFDADDTELRREFAVASNKVGDVLLSDKRYPEALDAYEKALAIRQRLTDSDPGNVVWQRDLAISNYNIGQVQAGLGHVDDALTAFQRGLLIEGKLAQSYPANVDVQRDLAMTYIKIGDLAKDNGKLDYALRSYGDFVAVGRRMMQARPDDPTWQGSLRFGASRISFVAYRIIMSRDFSGGLKTAEQAIALAPEVAWLNLHRAHALMFLDRTDEARALYLQYRDAKNLFGDVQKPTSWAQFVAIEFGELRAAGLEHPLMAEIEKQLAAVR